MGKNAYTGLTQWSIIINLSLNLYFIVINQFSTSDNCIFNNFTNFINKKIIEKQNFSG